MPLHIWLSELSVQLALITVGSAIHGVCKSHRWVERCQQPDSLLDREWLPRWRRLHRYNVAWLIITILLLAFQLRIHLFQSGLLPAPGR